ncbi:MAG: RecQ family ATP-dependent DNA helicase [Bdellovibrionales bacterium]|nr:RecQ family ATP-dependent DNA helicase [Bdellovibrionales bacterium]
MNIKAILNSQFGYDEFRGSQAQVIESVLKNQSVLAVMPTGQGKSLCFQLPSVILPGLTLVISPLIALMKDQVDQARDHGLKAAFINSSQKGDERDRVLQKVASGDITLLYVTPERFRKKDFLDVLAGLKVSLFVVDEAHCISEWGHDFRPDFTRLGDYREQLGNPVTLAVTATATQSVQKDILQQLRLPAETVVVNDDIDRPNLSISCLDLHGIESKIRAFIGLHHQYPGSKIVYFSLITSLENFSRELRKLNIPHRVYHGQLPPPVRKRHQQEFLSDAQGIMLATPAFGLGINKPDVRAVIHGEIPGSIEAFYQEVGRAGRDGQPAQGILLYDEDDVTIQMDFLKWANPEPEFVRSVYHLLANNPERVKAEGLDFMRQQLHFYHSRDYRLETALNLLERNGNILGGRPNDGAMEDWTVIEPPQGEWMDVEYHDKRLKGQQRKLLQMVQLTRAEDMKSDILKYFAKDDLLSPPGAGLL